MTKPAILHICLSQGWGGLEMYPIRTGQEFLKRGYNVYGLCTSGTQVASGMRDSGIEAFEVSSKGQLIASQLLRLNHWLKQRNVEIIHCHKSGDILVSALLSLLTRRKTFFTEHMGVTRPKKDLYHKWAYSHVDQIFSISNETYQRNLKALPLNENKITRLWLGTDIPEQPIDNLNDIATIKLELGLPKDSIVIGNLGRVCSGKGQMELLIAFDLLIDKYPKLHLLLVGGLDVSEGSDNSFVIKLKDKINSLGLTKRVHLVGFRTDTGRMLAVMDIVCLPNHNEAFGLTAIEAMAAKKAVVGANTGALPEILEPVALLCDPLNPSKIASNIEKYLQDPALKKNNANLSFARANAEFSMTAHITKLSKYYEQVVNAPNKN
ncbi:glycosyltransferase family 4 protein [Vibrio coralliilyticus]|uniref:glycosyltransferase family 4 protein n=1 Tax=Vibrio coralliilyticus TaxID=190893 RepID=UPI002FD03961